MNRAELIEALELAEASVDRERHNRLDRWKPNKKQREFCDSQAPETAFLALNQWGGKSYCLKGLTATQLTGKYPPWWKGKRFARPVIWAIGGETIISTMDLLINGIHKEDGDEIIGLLGPYEDRGTGWIPGGCFTPEDIEYVNGGAIKHQVEKFRCKHFTDGVFDGYSTCLVFSYKSGWERFRGYTLDGVSMDEEPGGRPQGEISLGQGFLIYDQFSTRINKTRGVLYLAMSPEAGYTQIVRQFDKDQTGIRKIVFGTIDDATHMSEDDKSFANAKYSDHYMRDVRLYGRWVMGEGLIYNVPPEDWVCDDFQIPAHWKRICAIDIPHTTGSFAATWRAIDPVTGVRYVYREYKGKNQPRSVYADALLAGGCKTIPVAWPHDAGIDSETAPTASFLRDRGINALYESAKFILDDGAESNSIQEAIDRVRDGMRLGTLKVFRSCNRYQDEIRAYYSKDGYPAKGQEDHLINADHKAEMMERYAEAPRHSPIHVQIRPPVCGSEEFFGAN